MNKKVLTRSLIGIMTVVVVATVGILVLNFSTPHTLTVSYINEALRGKFFNITKTITGDEKTTDQIWNSITSQQSVENVENVHCASPSFQHQYRYDFMFSTLHTETRHAYVVTQGCGLWYTSGIFGWGARTYCCASAELWSTLEKLAGIPSPYS